MGNTNSKADSSPSSPAGHEHKTRRDHPKNLIQSQKAALASPNLVQARGTTTHVSHRSRNSQSTPTAQLIHQSSTASGHSVGSPSQAGAEGKINTRDQPSKPVDVPIPAANLDSTSINSNSQSYSLDPLGQSATQEMSGHLQRPPRLPLPIQEEVHTPGSPIIEAAEYDLDAPTLDLGPSLPDVPDRISQGLHTLSNTTLDEEEADELSVDKSGATVPIIIEWRSGGEKVYVTGSIFQWNKKQRLLPVEGQPNLLRTSAMVAPGTHHIRFVVDTMMRTSPDLPTTVDFGNNLVNYLIITPEDKPYKTHPSTKNTTQPPSELAQGQPKSEDPRSDPDVVEEPVPEKLAVKTKPAVSPAFFHNVMAPYLTDYELPENSPEYAAAAAIIDKLPPPPGLPYFLSKPILNQAAPIKDDNSVLLVPNHVVLNHLTTSSIKGNILAISATTRYNKKVVTTIMYKPAGDD